MTTKLTIEHNAGVRYITANRVGSTLTRYIKLPEGNKLWRMMLKHRRLKKEYNSDRANRNRTVTAISTGIGTFPTRGSLDTKLHWTIFTITKRGTAYVGCLDITFAEGKKIAKELGWKMEG